MPLDEFKTQVLLLHSEQSTLDNLSSGFSDRYTVHCATSGSEALNTLVDTPINVIVTAQDLPGMSGLEALREARKRSPDTIGILLAGKDTRNLEALVGDEEVFQVVSGNVTGDGLLTLVDNATRQMRLMALAESANDTSANVDEPAEHIIMETSENGATIISDGTGRMPALDPKKVSAAANVGARSVDILVLTQDQEFLETIKDSSRGMHKVYYANTLAQANEAIRAHRIGVAVVDAAMVGEKVEQLTQHLRKGSSRLVSIVAGRRDDGEMLMDLINRGKVYRFLLKPVSPGRARLAVEASVKHHLEAPDVAFKIKADAVTPNIAAAKAKPAAKPQSKPAAPKPAADDAAPKAAAAVPAPKPAPELAPTPAVPADPPLGSESTASGGSLIEDGLADAFGGDDGSFTETVTGLFSTVARKLSPSTDDEPKREKPASVEEAAEPVIENVSGSGGEGTGGSLFSNPKIMGVAAAAVVVIAGGLFWFLGGSDKPTVTTDDEIPAPTFAEQEVVMDEAPLPSGAAEPDDTLNAARIARDAGQIFNPKGNNAIELFSAALLSDPGNAVIVAELDAAIGQALAMAESAMLESRLDDSDAALQRVAAADPQNSRLPFLTAQLSQMQSRARLDDARLAIREFRFEDAASALSAARSLGIADSFEIDAVAAELTEARSAQQVDDVLAKAAARVDTGNLLQPANDNARYYFRLVLSNDPNNAVAQQGLSVIASKLAFRARAEIDSGDLNGAEDTLANARAIDPQNSEVVASYTTLTETRAEIARQQRLAEAERAAEAERVAAAEKKAAADRQVALDRQAEADRQAAADRQAEADRQAAAIALAAQTPPPQDTEINAGGSAPPASAGNLAKPVELASNAAADSSRAIEIESPTPKPVALQRPAAISSFKRTKYVAPKYPRSAQRRNISGWVDVVFMVTIDGTVADIEVRNSEPGDTFVNAATRAVEKWEFEPVVENGVLVAKMAGVRMMFALE